MRKFQDYVLSYKPENKTVILNDDIKKFMLIDKLEKKITYNTFKEEWKIEFNTTAFEIAESIPVNTTLLSFEGERLNKNDIFNVFKILSNNINKYSLTENSNPPDYTNYRDYFELVHSRNRSSYCLMLNQKIYNFNKSEYQDYNIRFEQAFNFNQNYSYWNYIFKLHFGEYNAYFFNVYYKYNKFMNKNMYYLTILKYSKNGHLRTLFSDIFSSYSELLFQLENKSSKILRNKLKRNIKLVLDDNNSLNDSNIESLKELAKLVVY